MWDQYPGLTFLLPSNYHLISQPQLENLMSWLPTEAGSRLQNPKTQARGSRDQGGLRAEQEGGAKGILSPML